MTPTPWPTAFAEFTRPAVPLAAFTRLRVGGPAEHFVEPRSVAELAAVLTHCHDHHVPLRVLGSGYNLLVRDEPLSGVVLRLGTPAFAAVTVTDRHVRAGCGAMLPDLIAAAARAGLTGFESLVGIPATVGGALRFNAGDRSGEMGQLVRRVEVLGDGGTVHVRERDELRFGDHHSNLDDAVLLAAEFELERDSEAAIVKRLRKSWVQRQARQPYPFQASARVFQNPRGQSAQTLLEQAGVKGARVGQAEVSDRNANCVVAHAGCTARDVRRLIDLMRDRVLEQTGIGLQPEIVFW